MKKVAIIIKADLPVPAVKGGAVEHLVQTLLDKNEINPCFFFTVFSIYDKKAVCVSMEYKYTKFVFINPKPFFYQFKRGVRYVINRFKLVIIPNQFLHVVINHPLIKDQDIIVIENSILFSVHVKRKITIPVVQHLHGDDISSINKWTPDVFFSTDFFITVSEYILNRVSKVASFYELKYKSETLHNGIDIQKFRNKPDCFRRISFRNELGISSDEIVLIFIGRLHPQKGVRELVRAFSQLRIKYLNVKLLIVGSSWFSNIDPTPFMKELEQLSVFDKEYIIFTNYVQYENIHDYYQIADIAVLPSVWEDPFPLTCLESLAAGLPLIVTNSGGIPEAITDDCAIVVNKENDLVSNLVQAIDELVSDEKKRHEMSVNALNRSLQFSDELYFKNFCKIIENNF